MCGQLFGFYIDIHLFLKSVWMWLEILGLKIVQTAPTYAKFRIIFKRGNNMGCNANKKKMGSKKSLRISKWVVNY